MVKRLDHKIESPVPFPNTMFLNESNTTNGGSVQLASVSIEGTKLKNTANSNNSFDLRSVLKLSSFSWEFSLIKL